MLRKMLKKIGLTALLAVTIPMTASADINQENDYNYDRTRADQYLDVEIWTDNSDGEYFEGDDIVINFRANRDAFVAIYSIDSRGRVNLLFPIEQGDNNYIEGGIVYQLPGDNDDYDLVVSGPEGTETIQIIASKERFPIPEWYPVSGLDDDNWNDRHEFMDYLNNRYFVNYDGQRFAYDRTSIYINEWEENYYRPVYRPIYPGWTVCGNVYVDYPYGGTVYINGIYWGIAPLYIPRIYVGWHTVTIYDRYGYCWESDIHINTYNTLVLNRNIIRPHRSFVSKYKEVRRIGYRNPARHGYPNYKQTSVNVTKLRANQTIYKGGVVKSSDGIAQKKFVRGSTKVVKSDRGYKTVRTKATVKSTKQTKNSKSYKRKTSTKTSKEKGQIKRTTTKSSEGSKKATVKKRTNKSTKKSSGKQSTVKKSSRKSKSSQKSTTIKKSKQNKKNSEKSTKVKKSNKSSKSNSSNKSNDKSKSSSKKSSSSKKKSKR
jgi:hypothetical protein